MPDKANQDNLNASFDAQISRVAVKIPPFYSHDPVLWLAQVERSFESAGVTVETTKYGYVAAALDPAYAECVKDLIVSPPADRPFTKLKEELIKRLGSSQETKVRQLLEKEEMGDRKPSQFLRRLRDLGNGMTGDSFLRTLWMSRIPPAAQAILVAHKTLGLDQLAELADSIYDVITPMANVHEVRSTSSAETTLSAGMEDLSLRDEIRAMRRQIEALEDKISRKRDVSRSRSSNRSRSRSRSRSVPPADTCWYHHVFGAKAKKRKGESCKFAGNEKAGK